MIKSKEEASAFLKNFETFAQWDGKKYYLTIETVNPIGTLTIMKSKNGKFFYHRKNELYWDLQEIMIDTDILIDIIWVFRTAISKSIKMLV
ncbi:hypothetical protein [Neobacillus jeddahensis]|uniref:hypothetical protein n=1 Tax=Neobacillus jeddahensis TaxID=1461580 RepID=UPI00058EC3D3|nr:hypothetical protein [Neobacillus jeddahensis]